MTMNKTAILFLLPLLFFFPGCAQINISQGIENYPSKIVPAAGRTALYLPFLKNKRVAVFANNTSMLENAHLVDTLSKLKVNIKKIFAPEHGFRGTADAGEKVSGEKDRKTGIDIISLYGKKRKPSREDLEGVDIILFDIQDVGVRFYTYISSLQDLMEAAIDNDKPLIVLDRPNPNGFYVDGPVLDPRFKSFLGMQQIPVVYGMTMGEYAKMILGENWIDSGLKRKPGFKLTVIPCDHYTHKSRYVLPVKPSPNLPDIVSVYCYPSTCLFEGTILSEGRGTERPFQIFGHPSLPDSLYSFTPTSRDGAKKPKLVNQLCHGWDIGGTNEEVLNKLNNRLQLRWLIEAYRLFPSKDSFFINNGKTFNMLAGNDELIKQIKNNESEETIRASWKPAIDKFKKTRKKYLLYKDYE